jgi:hypothetical protein
MKSTTRRMGLNGSAMLLALTTGAWVGCATESNQVAAQGTAIAAAPEALIQMRRSGCADAPCPVYSVSIYLDGTVVYEGRANVSALGERRWKISSEPINQLLREMAAMDFLDTPEGSGICPDATATAIVILDYHPGSTQKTVIHDERCGGAPPALAALEEAIDRLTGTERWIATRSTSSPVAVDPI